MAAYAPMLHAMHMSLTPTTVAGSEAQGVRTYSEDLVHKRTLS